MSSLPWCCAIAKNSLPNSATTNVSCTVLRMRVRQVKRLRTATGRWEQYTMVLPRTPRDCFQCCASHAEGGVWLLVFCDGAISTSGFIAPTLYLSSKLPGFGSELASICKCTHPFLSKESLPLFLAHSIGQGLLPLMSFSKTQI